MSAPDFDSTFDHLTHSAFRLETQQHYDAPGEDTCFAAFLRGGSPWPEGDPSDYLRHVAERTRSGCTWRRVHVVTEPLSDYVRFELVYYARNVAHGEQVRILPVPPGGSWPPDVATRDFWLFDQQIVFTDPHGHGWTADPTAGEAARPSAEAAWNAAIPWATYLTFHPELDRIARTYTPAALV